jgi:hypothetical protein
MTTHQQAALLGIFTLLGASGTTGGQVCIESLDGTGATTVLNASGQGNFSCSNMSPGPDGAPMQNISGSVSLIIRNNYGTPVTTGTEVDVQVSSGLPGREIDAVYIRTQGNGARCLYSFSDYSESATGLRSGGGQFSASDVIVCADGTGTTPPVEPEVVEPISTAADACEGEVFATGAAVEGLSVVSGVSLDGKTVAVCSAPGSQQFQCVNRCENFTPRGDTEACALASAGLGNGQKDLEACRPCDLSIPESPPATDQNGNPLFYCWEYASSVVRNPPLSSVTYPNAPGTVNIPGTEIPGPPIPRTPGTMLPHPSIGGTSFEVQSYNPCTTTTTWLNGRQYTYTTCR